MSQKLISAQEARKLQQAATLSRIKVRDAGTDNAYNVLFPVVDAAIRQASVEEKMEVRLTIENLLKGLPEPKAPFTMEDVFERLAVELHQNGFTVGYTSLRNQTFNVGWREEVQIPKNF